MKKYFLLSIYMFLGTQVFARVGTIKFQELIYRCSMIAIGTYGQITDSIFIDTQYGGYYISQRCSIFANEVLLESTPVGELIVDKHGVFPGLKKGDPVVVFLNKQKKWEWVGVPYDKNTTTITDKTLIYIKGLMDGDSYFVHPSLVSLGQIKQFIKEKKFTNRLVGNAQFFSEKTKRLEKSNIYFEINYTVDFDSIRTMARSNGLEIKLPTVSIFTVGENLFFYEPYSYLSIFRDKKLCGWFFVRVKAQQPKSDAWEAEFTPTVNFSYREFRKYMKDTTLGIPYYQMELITGENQSHTLFESGWSWLTFEREIKKEIIEKFDKPDIYIVWDVAIRRDGKKAEVFFEDADDKEWKVEFDPTELKKDQIPFLVVDDFRMSTYARRHDIGGELFEKIEKEFISRGNCKIKYTKLAFSGSPLPRY